ncbi:MAG: hypothetical protein KAU28_02445, partial [Phycisphaerae bacterium]|nr:hypothetical protein [Phycisphaerae bacterium]
MRKHISIVILALLVMLFLVTYTIAFQVDEFRDIVVITTFGRTDEKDVYRDKDGAGLHLKWIYPVQEVVRYDKRTHIFEDAHAQVQTKDKHNLLVTMFCAWRIEDPIKFLKTIGTEQKAQDSIRSILKDSKNAVIGNHVMGDFVNTAPDKMLIPQIEQEIQESVDRQAFVQYGVRVVMVGVRSMDLPAEITKSVISSMKEERQKFAQDYKSSGEARAIAIRSLAETARDKIIAFAERKAKEIRTEGARAAAEYYAKFERYPQLGMFLRYIE